MILLSRKTEALSHVSFVNASRIAHSLILCKSVRFVAGMIIALPITTVIISYYKRYVLQEEEAPAETDREEKPQE